LKLKVRSNSTSENARKFLDHHFKWQELEFGYEVNWNFVRPAAPRLFIEFDQIPKRLVMSSFSEITILKPKPNDQQPNVLEKLSLSIHYNGTRDLEEIMNKIHPKKLHLYIEIFINFNISKCLVNCIQNWRKYSIETGQEFSIELVNSRMDIDFPLLDHKRPRQEAVSIFSQFMEETGLSPSIVHVKY
jgi:hypothetical protein